MRYTIEKADTQSKYEGLRDLWRRVFGDEPEYVDYVYDLFGEDITGYVVCSGDKVVSALTCYRCGDIGGRPVYVSYAVCTDPEFRGQGHAGKLTEYVRKVVTADAGAVVQSDDAEASEGLGSISIVSPANAGLIGFYRTLGYSESCFVRECTAYAEEDDGEEFITGEDDDFEAAVPAFDVRSAEPGEYNMYREAFLRDVPHVSLSRPMLDLVRSESMEGEGLLVINNGDAIAAVSGADEGAGGIRAAELIVNPMLRAFSEEIGLEIASGIAEHFGAASLTFREPADENDADRTVQSMVSSDTDTADFYYGFPID